MALSHGLHGLHWMEYFSGLDIFEIWVMGSSIQGRGSKYGFNLVEQLPPPGWTHFFKSLNFLQRTLSSTWATTTAFRGHNGCNNFQVWTFLKFG